MGKALDTLYKVLDFQRGSLLTASDKPTSSLRLDDWLEKGEWLAAAKRAGADKVFFVENNPVAVFAECGSDHLEKERAFNRIWCLGRPRNSSAINHLVPDLTFLNAGLLPSGTGKQSIYVCLVQGFGSGFQRRHVSWCK